MDLSLAKDSKRYREKKFIITNKAKDPITVELECGLLERECPFCKCKGTFGFKEHYYFCPNCTAIYTYCMLQKSNCKHMIRDIPIAEREPWFPKVREESVYVKELTKKTTAKCGLYNYRCSDTWRE